jgi:hypothetical protein
MGTAALKGLVRSCLRVSSYPVAGWIELKYTEITDAQREILKHVYDTDDASTISQMWYVLAQRPGMGC